MGVYALEGKKTASKEDAQQRAEFPALFSIARLRINFKYYNTLYFRTEGVEDNYLYNLALIV